MILPKIAINCPLILVMSVKSPQNMEESRSYIPLLFPIRFCIHIMNVTEPLVKMWHNIPCKEVRENWSGCKGSAVVSSMEYMFSWLYESRECSCWLLIFRLHRFKQIFDTLYFMLQVCYIFLLLLLLLATNYYY